MSNIDTGNYGAKRQSFHEKSPRDLLLQIMTDYPRSSKAEVFVMFWQRCAEMDNEEFREYAKPVFDYWFSNNYMALHRAELTPRDRKKATARLAKRREQIRAEIQTSVRRKVELLFLDMVLPNGKALRECTGSECARLAPKVGKFLGKLGAAIKPRQVVGDVYTTDAELRQFWK